MRVSVIDYGIGNIKSVTNAIIRAGGDAVIAYNGNDLINQNADRIVLPGVGSAGQALENLRKNDLETALNKCVVEDSVPFLGICVGMQIIAEQCNEFGKHKGFGWIPGTVDKLTQVKESLKLPHVGWNSINVVDNDSFFKELNGHDFYFVHSYALKCPEQFVSATTEYGRSFISAVRRNHIAGVQFHPEKSSKLGNVLLTGFLKGLN